MKTKKVWANLSTADVERTRKFYKELGFTPNEGHKSPEPASFLVGENDFVVHFFSKDSDQFKKSLGGEIAD